MGDHRPGCGAGSVVCELDVASLPRREKHPTIFRLLERLEIGETLPGIEFGPVVLGRRPIVRS
jgi:hypothetical protein